MRKAYLIKKKLFYINNISDNTYDIPIVVFVIIMHVSVEILV